MPRTQRNSKWKKSKLKNLYKCIEKELNHRTLSSHPQTIAAFSAVFMNIPEVPAFMMGSANPLSLRTGPKSEKSF